ncbi:ATP-dependent nuclease [Mangrovicoccus ximenensis]|uniref:ATP-dependent nuclease n=1 Tax=Mangrovicoccus ximenensis TaxID=1911570 RepID=UPI001F26519B|nr:TOPRIM nucleotidyl transferase/hydrolase domain-containing protein [Mangrovicoccus ximenensis]
MTKPGPARYRTTNWKSALLHKEAAFATQLVVSTHSGHIAHAAAFEELRYFKRELPDHGVVPTATVANMTGLFGEDTETQRIVTRYLLSTHFDLFFADAIVVIEGAAERILLPHLIQHHYPDLAVAYLSFLRLGGQPRTPHAALDRGAGGADADHHRSRCRDEGKNRGQERQR